MSVYGSQRGLQSISRRAGSRSEVEVGNYHVGGNGFGQEFAEDYNYTFSKGSMGGGQGPPIHVVIHQRASMLQGQCQELLHKADYILQTETDRVRATAEAEHCMMSAREAIEQLKVLAVDLRNMGQPNENILMTVDECTEQLRAVHMALGGSMQRKSRSSRSSIGWDETERNVQQALSWIAQQKRLIETSSWGDEPAFIDQQIMNHSRFHSSIQRSVEVERAQEELRERRDKGGLHLLEQEWDSLQKMSFERGDQLHELQNILGEITREIMWVNDREEEELMFDWGNKNIDAYIPKKQESYSRLMSDLEEKEKDLNKLKAKVDNLLVSNHPASDKIEAYMETLQTQWSWLLQITKCIHVHLKENSAYSQFFIEANETYGRLQQQHEIVRKKYACDKSTPLANLQEILISLEKEKDHLMEHKQQVQQLVNKSKNIVRLRPRNPEEKSTSPVKVQALCDFRQDQKVICKDDIAILKDNTERSKWLITGPGGLDMEVPSVCLLVPPPNPLSINLANKNEQYFEALQSVWNQLFINIKSLISWQYCLHDISRINSLTITMLAQMRPEEYRSIIKSLESHYQEYQRNSLGSEMFGDEDKRAIESQYTGAQKRYDQMIEKLPAYAGQQTVVVDSSVKAASTTLLQGAMVSSGVNQVSSGVSKVSSSASRVSSGANQVSSGANQLSSSAKKVSSGASQVSSGASQVSSGANVLSELHAVQLKLEALESAVSTHQHIPVGQGAPAQCASLITSTQAVVRDVESLKGEFQRLKDQVLTEVEGMKDTDKAQFLHSQLNLINQRLERLGSHSSAYLLRLKALKSLLQGVLQAEDVVKVYEARLTERETTSLDPAEVQKYQNALKVMRSELDQKDGVLRSLEDELNKARQCNAQIDPNCHRCDVDLCLYSDHVKQLSDRWKRIQAQINTRFGDLDAYLQQLKQYLASSTALDSWINDIKSRIDAQLTTRTDDIVVLSKILNQQKALNSEIAGKRETVEAVQRDGEICVNSIKDYELGLASYSAGLETLLNIPIKKTMLQSPTTVVIQEVSSLHSRYLELLTRSGDYCKSLGDSLKNLEELKMRNTKIDLLEEELRLLRADVEDRDAKNVSMREALSRYQVKLNESQDHLLSLEEVKRSQALQCSTAQANLSSSQNHLQELMAEVERLKRLVEEEKRSRKIVEERYNSQQEEHEGAMRKRLKELEGANWAKLEFEKTVSDRTLEIERVRRQLEAESQNLKQAQMELAKTSSSIRSSQAQCTELQQERDGLLKKIRTLEENMTNIRKTEEDLRNAKLSLETELRLKKQLQDENERLRNEFSTWKKQRQNQDESVQQQISERMKLEGECSSLRTRMEQLQVQLKEVEERYKLQLQGLKQERNDLVTIKDSLQEQVQKGRQSEIAVNRYTQTDFGTVDPSTLVFDGVRKKVTALQLHECGVIDQKTLDHLLKGYQNVQDVSVNIKLNLKGTGAIAGLAGPSGRLTLTEAKKDDLISADSAVKLLEAQAATGYILDPRANLKMTVEEACLNGLVDEGDKKQLLTAEAACLGFRDASTAKLLSASQAMRKGIIDQETALRLLQAQEAAGGILDPVLSVYLPKDIARDRNVIDEAFYQALSAKPNCYIDPETNLSTSYVNLKRQCKADPNTGLLLLPAPPAPLTVQGLREKVSLSHLVEANLLEPSDLDQLREGKLTSQDIEHRLRAYLQGSTCIAGVYDETDKRILGIYQAMKEGLLRPGTTLELLEAQAASGFIIDPINNQYYTVEEACKKGLVGAEFKDKLLSAERAVTGYKDPGSEKIISLFQAIEKGLIEKGHGIRLLEAQIASGGIIDPKQSHRIDVDVAFKRGYFGEEMNQILKDEGDDTKGFFDPNTQDNLTYLQLKSRCMTDDKTGLVLLPLHDKNKISTQKNTTRKTRVVIVDPDTNKEMTVHEAYQKGLIDYETYIELSKQESEWEEITITASDGTSKLVISDRKTGLQYDLKELLDKGVINDANLHEYRSGNITLTEFVDIITAKTIGVSKPLSSSSPSSASSVSSQTVRKEIVTLVGSAPSQQAPMSPNSLKRIASMSITLTSAGDITDEQSPVGAIFDTEKSEKISIYKAMKQGLVDSITAQRLLEAQACTGGVVNPENGRRISIQEATRSGIIDDDMANRLKPAQKAYIGFEDMKTKKKLSAAEAVKEKWLPFEAGQRFLEFQFLTGGLFDPELGHRRSLDEAVRLGWMDSRTSQKLLDTRHHPKMLTCPKTKLRITYKEAMDACMLEDKTGVRMLPAAATSSRGISSPYNSNPSSAPSSRTGSRRGSVDQTYSNTSTSRYSSFSYSSTSFSSRSLS